MALVVEDGTGLSDAESYVSTQDASSYATARGLAFPVDAGDALTAAEAALRRATTWLDATYRSYWPGTRVRGRAQALEWPRSEACDAAGYAVASDAVPVEVKNATIEAAVRELAKPGSLAPDFVLGQVRRSVRVEGAIDVTYAGSGSSGDQRPTFDIIDGILSSLISGAGNSVFGTRERG